MDGESSSGANYPNTKKDLSFDRLTIQSGINEHSWELQDFDVIDGFLGRLETQG